MAFETNPKEANLVVGVLGWFDGIVFLLGAIVGSLPERVTIIGSMVSIAVGTLGFIRWAMLPRRKG